MASVTFKSILIDEPGEYFAVPKARLEEMVGALQFSRLVGIENNLTPARVLRFYRTFIHEKNQGEFAKLVGASEKTIWNIENNETVPGPAMIDEMAKVLGQDFKSLMLEVRELTKRKKS